MAKKKDDLKVQVTAATEAIASMSALEEARGITAKIADVSRILSTRREQAKEAKDHLDALHAELIHCVNDSSQGKLRSTGTPTSDPPRSGLRRVGSSEMKWSDEEIASYTKKYQSPVNLEIGRVMRQVRDDILDEACKAVCEFCRDGSTAFGTTHGVACKQNRDRFASKAGGAE